MSQCLSHLEKHNDRELEHNSTLTAIFCQCCRKNKGKGKDGKDARNLPLQREAGDTKSQSMTTLQTSDRAAQQLLRRWQMTT